MSRRNIICFKFLQRNYLYIMDICVTPYYMIHTLYNEQFEVAISSYGAELHSIYERASKTEFLWNGDPAVWESHAPILFPVVGRLRDSKFIIDGKEYSMDIHGFARISEFTLAYADDVCVEWHLKNNETTESAYPFSFLLKVRYELSKNGVSVVYTVCNTGNKILPFSIGSHAALMCPQYAGETVDEYEFVFEKQESIFSLNADGGFIVGEALPYKNGTAIKVLTFEEIGMPTGLILRGVHSKWIDLHNKKTNRSVRIHTGGAPTIVFWKNQAPNPTRFVCIEPWFGLPDAIDTDHQFTKKRELQFLDPHSEFSCDHSIELI